MNQIKFRAWDPIDKKMWFNGQEGETDEKTDGTFQTFFEIDGCLTAKLLWIEDDGSEHPMVTDRELILSRFTGMKDKYEHPMEIYENDIIFEPITNKFFTVDYDESGGSYLFCEVGSTEGVDYWKFEEISSFWMVIGNIYENPNLLGNSQ